MTTITWRRGERRTEFVAVETDDGSPPDLTDATARVRIQTTTACHDMPLVPSDGGFDWHLTPETVPDLPPCAYRATLTITRGDQDDLVDLVFLIEGGC